MKRILALLLFASPLCSQTVIPIANHSFEDAAPVASQDACAVHYYQIPGWAYPSRGVIVFAPVTPRTCDFSNPPDGVKMVNLGDASISQDLGDVYTLLPHDANGEANGFYTLKVWVAGYFYWYPGHYLVALLLMQSGQTEELCSTSGWDSGDFTEITLVCPAQRQFGELILTFSSNAAQRFENGQLVTIDYPTFFDNVSLTFTPTN